MKRVLVFGGRGLVGSNICKEAVLRNFKVVSLSRNIPPLSLQIPGVEYATVDALDATAVEKSFGEYENVSGVVCSIGSPPVPWADKDFQIQMNGDSNVNVLKAAEAAGVPKVVLANASMPQWVPSGYLMGKQMAEAQAKKYNGSGRGALIMKLPAVSGTRYLDSGLPIPLWIFFAPLRFLFGNFEQVF